MRHYVCGFLFTPEIGDLGKQSVALIKKNRPKWQAGLYNGIGGKVEDGEELIHAMVREFKEETNALVPSWTPFCKLIHSAIVSKSMPSGPWTVHFFKAFQYIELSQTTDEQVRWWNVQATANRLNNYFVPNLHWLIPMALEDISAEVYQPNWPHEQ
jgi:8-oxo-dGTP diphosphatase